jgi:hypothetical protein
MRKKLFHDRTGSRELSWYKEFWVVINKLITLGIRFSVFGPGQFSMRTSIVDLYSFVINLIIY